MSRSEARFQARMLFGRTRTLSDEQRSEQSERARRTIMKEARSGALRTRCSKLANCLLHAVIPTQNWWRSRRQFVAARFSEQQGRSGGIPLDLLP